MFLVVWIGVFLVDVDLGDFYGFVGFFFGWVGLVVWEGVFECVGIEDEFVVGVDGGFVVVDYLDYVEIFEGFVWCLGGGEWGLVF